MELCCKTQITDYLIHDPYSDDLRQKAVDAVKRGERKKDVSEIFGISRNSLDLWLKRAEETGSCRPVTHFRKGHSHKITDWDRFRNFVVEQGDKTQAQMAKLWGDRVTQQNISKALRKMGFSRKKNYGDRERDDLERQLFQERLKTIEPERIVYVDEAGIDNRQEYPDGYSEIGQRFYALKSGKRTERVSWIATLQAGDLFAPMTFVGTCNRDLFEQGLAECLLPQLQIGDISVIDNASFHHSQIIEEMVLAAGCEIWYLPPYSPDYNEIEHR